MIIILAFALLLTGCNDNSNINDQEGSDDITDGNEDNTQPNLENNDGGGEIPQNTQEPKIDKFSQGTVAVVNDEEIDANEVNQILETMSQQGQQIEKQDALEQVISEKLISQEVKKENISVSTQEAEEKIKEELQKQGSNLEQFKQQLQTQGVSYEEQIEEIKTQLASNNYLESKVNTEEIDITEEETKQFYEQYKQQSPQEVPEYEQVKPQLEQQLKQQKQQEMMNSFIEELKEKANIEYKQ